MTEVDPTPSAVRLVGFLDVRGVAEARAVLAQGMEVGEGDVVVDVTDLVALDATGLALLVAAHRRAVAQGRRLVLDGVRPPLARLLAVTRLNRVLVIRRSHEAADRPGRPAAEDPAA